MAQVRKIWVLFLALATLSSSPPVATYAVSQTSAYPESVSFDSSEGPTRLALPGQTLAFLVQGVATFYAPLLEVIIPPGLEVEVGHTCDADALLDPIGEGNQNAQTSALYCSGTLTVESDGSSRFRIQTGETVKDVLYYYVSLHFDLTVPEDTEPGLLFSIIASIAGMHELFETSNIEVLNSDGSRQDQVRTPTPIAVNQVTPPVNTSPLMLMPNVIEVSAGASAALDLHIPRSAMWELAEFAFLGWAEQSTITNLDAVFLDDDGSAACSAGSEEDTISVIERTMSTQEGASVPSRLEFRVNEDPQPGQQLRVCVELIGFGGGTELYSWNVYGVVIVK